jgi:AcrR family transcriptional regulator
MVKKDLRPRGRPRSFDEGEAIRQATKVFWEKGYDGATIDDLVEGMGVRRPSLYAIFGDKATLFARCLEAYRVELGKLASEAFLGPTDVLGAVRGLLRVVVENATGKGSPLGCLMVCVAPLVEDDQIRAYLARSGSEVTAVVAQRLQEGVAAGELPPDFPCETRARLAMDLARGLVVRARIGVSREALLNDAEDAAALVLAH